MENDWEKLNKPETYDQAEWQKLQQGPKFLALQKGKEIGVPEKEVQSFAKNVLDQAIADKKYDFAYRFMKSTSQGTDQEIDQLGKSGYDYYMEQGLYEDARSMAADIWGISSQQWEKADELNRSEIATLKAGQQKKELDSGNLIIVLPPDPTFADLNSEIAKTESEPGESHFADELIDNFGHEIAEEVLNMMDNQENINIKKYFKDKGYSIGEITTYLPVNFKKRIKKK